MERVPDLVAGIQLLLGEAHADRPQVLFELLDGGGAADDRRDAGLVQDPGEGELSQ